MKETAEPTKYTQQIVFRAKPTFGAAITEAAAAQMCSTAAWLRAACLVKLKAEGRALPTEREAA
jgi:hypothetical protein